MSRPNPSTPAAIVAAMWAWSTAGSLKVGRYQPITRIPRDFALAMIDTSRAGSSRGSENSALAVWMYMVLTPLSAMRSMRARVKLGVDPGLRRLMKVGDQS